MVEALKQFDWCDDCARPCGSVSDGPPSGGQKKMFKPCQAGCGLRLRQIQLPLIEQYSRLEEQIEALKDKFQMLEEKDNSMREFYEKQESYKNQEKQLKYAK